MDEKIISNTFDIPILLLIFNRPDTTEQVFQSIRSIKPARLYIAADGPRMYKLEEQALCVASRNIVNKIDWDCEVKTLFRESNLGCRIAVSSAISWFFQQEDMGIILEDDCLPDITFYNYCRELLYKYKDCEDIMLIGGHNFLNNKYAIETSYYFSQYSHIWGWATWRRAWEFYDIEMSDLNKFIDVDLKKTFKSTSQRNHFKEHLILTKNGVINTWDYQWSYSILKNKGKSITPKFNLIMNLGFMNQSTHVFLKDSKKEIDKPEQMQFPLIHPYDYEIDFDADLVTYRNVMSKSFKRVIHLINENGLLEFLKYVFNRFQKSYINNKFKL